jgi:hypothetical protein
MPRTESFTGAARVNESDFIASMRALQLAAACGVVTMTVDSLSCTHGAQVQCSSNERCSSKVPLKIKNENKKLMLESAHAVHSVDSDPIIRMHAHPAAYVYINGQIVQITPTHVTQNSTIMHASRAASSVASICVYGHCFDGRCHSCPLRA